MNFRASVLMLGLLLGSLAGEASAVDFAPRVGAVVGRYDLVSDSDFSAGLSAGVTAVTGPVSTDLNVETATFLVRDPANTGFQTNTVDGWRTDTAVTLSLPVWHSLSIIGGYRYVMYGTDMLGSNAATMRGPFAGIMISDLRMSGSEKDIFSFGFALQPTTYKAKGGDYGSESDVGVSIRLGYRQAGSRNSYAIRYQSFGGDESYDEYVTSFQYSYLF